MSGRKGMKHYPESFMQQIKREHDTNVSMRALKKKYCIIFLLNRIMVWSSYRGKYSSNLKRGRPNNKPEGLEKKVKRLEMENELL